MRHVAWYPSPRDPLHVERRRPWRAVLAGAIVAIAGCGPERQVIPSVTPSKEPDFETACYEKGRASWYGAECAGRPTASGEIFWPAAFSAAHRTLPFGTRVKVTNLENGRSVVVHINDRGPYTSDRILDCSQGAARALGFLGQGVTRVAIALPRGVSAQKLDSGELWVQLGAFRDRRAAEDLRDRLVQNHHPVFVLEDGPYLRVHTGPYRGRARAEKVLRTLEKVGLRGYVVRLD